MKASSLRFVVSCAVLMAAGVVLYSSCASPPKATAFRVASRSQLVGGQRALGDVGDFKLSNGLIHAIVQDIGHSRGFGAFGGSLIDVDLVRGSQFSPSTGVSGNDYFTEMFPAFFLEAIEPEKVEVLADGSEGAAIVRVSGKGGDFLSITKGVNDLVLPSPFEYWVDYILEPGKKYIKIVTTIKNPDKQNPAGFPLTIPFGFVTLLGEGQRLFVPGKAGYDTRFTLEDSYQNSPSGVTALPGIVASMIATEGEGVSYALAASPRGATYMSQARAQDPQFYTEAKNDSLLIPVASGSFLGSFWGAPPPSLPPQGTYSYTGYLAVGTGDVASAQKVIWDINEDRERKGVETSLVMGQVREQESLQPVEGASIVFRDEKGQFVSSALSLADGSFQAYLPLGKYRVTVVDSARAALNVDELLEVSSGKGARLHLEIERTSLLTVSVRDVAGRPLPAKVSVEAVYDDATGRKPYQFLYDLKLGERMRVSDLDPDVADNPESRRYLERIFFLPQGHGGRALRPGKYRVYASRGMEYDLVFKDIELKKGDEKFLDFTLNHVLPTPHHVSTDLHVHSINSVDSHMPLQQRIASYVAEGVDFLASTDHNFVSDYKPTVEAMGLEDWVKTSVGLELTTLEMGHFNAFPLKLDPGPVTHGSFNWFRRPPGDLFAQLRSMGTHPEKTLIQVNHPRDTILGYFNGFNVGSYTAEALPPTSSFSLDQTPAADGTPSPYAPQNFSFDFDLIEVFNGKRQELVYHYRIPQVAPEGAAPTVPACATPGPGACIPAVGEILQEEIEVDDAREPSGKRKVVQPVYPGALEDYYSLLAHGYKFTATGNSDSHGASYEAGVPRTFVSVGPSADGSMRDLKEEDVIDGLKAHRAIVTNGPFVEMWVNGLPVGSEVVSSTGTVEVKIRVQAAPWIDVTEVVLKRGGPDQRGLPQVLAQYDVTPSTEIFRFEKTETFTGLADGSYLVAEVKGEKSLWPVVTPTEIRSIQIVEAVSSVGSAFGFGNKYGKYFPNEVQQAKPFAFTNPIWVVKSRKQALKSTRRVLPLDGGLKSPARRTLDLRRMFGTLHSDVE